MTKWACKNPLALYNYSIDIEAILSPVYYLVLDLVRDQYKEQSFQKWAGEVFDVPYVTGKDALGEDDNEGTFLIALARRLERCLYKKTDFLEKKGVCMVYRSKRLIVAPTDIVHRGTLLLWLKQSGLIREFFDCVKHNVVNNTKDTIINLMNDQYFYTSIKSTSTELKATLLRRNIVADCDVTPIDEESIWICDGWKEKIGVNDDTEYGEITFDDNISYGIVIGEWMLPLNNIDEYVIPEAAQDYFWSMLNDVYAHRQSYASIYRDSCSEFADALKNSDFALLMTKLQYNLYIPKSEQGIPDAYHKFFEDVYNIDMFEGKTNQVLFTGSHVEDQLKNKQTMLGLYKTVKEDTEFNLRAWINADTEENQKLTTGKGVQKVNIKTVYALKPHYSYYFCKDYFEDMFSDLLKECGFETLANFELFKSEVPNKCFIEIDNMVRKEDGTIVYVENKTTMNRYNIEDTLNEVARFQQVMAETYPNVKMEYLMVSLYHNQTIEEGYGFFTNAKGSSITDFYVPVARFKDVVLHCVVEPEYDKLKEKIAHLLK